MKVIVRIFYYLLILLSCLAGACLAGKMKFLKEIIFLVYASFVLCAMAEMLLGRISFLKGKILYLRVFFAAACFACSFLALRTTDEMILKKELNLSMDTIQNAEIRMVPPYVVDMTFTVSHEEFTKIVNTLEFKPIEYSKFQPYKNEGISDKNDLIDHTETFLYFSKSNQGDYCQPLSIKYLVYDTNTMRVFYQHIDYKMVD